MADLNQQAEQGPRGPEQITGNDVDNIIFTGDYNNVDSISIFLKNGKFLEIRPFLNIPGINLQYGTRKIEACLSLTRGGWIKNPVLNTKAIQRTGLERLDHSTENSHE